jgi:hypothetical protein
MWDYELANIEIKMADSSRVDGVGCEFLRVVAGTGVKPGADMPNDGGSGLFLLILPAVASSHTP